MQKLRTLLHICLVLIAGKNLSFGQNTDHGRTLKLLQGHWVNQADSLATVVIENETWTFGYIGMEETAPDEYKIILTDILPESKIKRPKGEFLLLVNENDTLEYEMFGVSEDMFSQMFLPRGNMHVYLKK